jgi:protein-S-isoprenylcysteine O-methyltransferase Ste14
MSVMELRIVRPEEKVMLERFGEEYGRYRAGVRRWL